MVVCDQKCSQTRLRFRIKVSNCFQCQLVNSKACSQSLWGKLSPTQLFSFSLRRNWCFTLSNCSKTFQIFEVSPTWIMMNILKHCCGSIIVRNRFIQRIVVEVIVGINLTNITLWVYTVGIFIPKPPAPYFTVPGTVGLALDWLTPILHTAVPPYRGLLGYVAVLPTEEIDVPPQTRLSSGRDRYFCTGSGTFALDPVSVAVYPGGGVSRQVIRRVQPV